MRILILAFCLAVSVMSAQHGTTSLGTAPTQPAPFVTVTEKVDWGKVGVPEAGYLESKMYITNVAKSGIVKIVEIRPGCGCTKVTQDKDELQPGEKAEVTVRLNISPMQAGSVMKSISVRTALGTDTVMNSVMLSANIERLLTFPKGMYFAFGDIKVGSVSEKQITIENQGDVPVTITDVKTDGPFTVDLKNNTVIAPKAIVIVTALVEGAQPKQLNGAITFTAKGAKEEKFILSGYGAVISQ